MKHLIMALLLTTTTLHAAAFVPLETIASYLPPKGDAWEEAIDCDRAHYDSDEALPQECEEVDADNACDAE